MKITDLSAHRFPETKPLLTYLILFLLGVTLTLSGAFVFEQSSLLSRGAAGLGIGLLAAAVAGFLTDWIISPHSTEVLQKTISDAVGAPALLLPRRTLLTEMYQNMTKEATEIEIIGLTRYFLQRVQDRGNHPIHQKRKEFQNYVVVSRFLCSTNQAKRGDGDEFCIHHRGFASHNRKHLWNMETRKQARMAGLRGTVL